MITVDISASLPKLLPHLQKSSEWTHEGRAAIKSLCPYHEETTPSFAVFGNGGFKCYGCGKTGFVNQLCDHLKIPRIAESAERQATPTQRFGNSWLEATYHYRHGDGRRHGIVDVYRELNGNKKPLPKMHGADHYGKTKPFPLYRSEELARNKLDVIWFVEGEKCVEAMRERGFLATTNQGGSKNYAGVDEESLTLLNKRSVVIIPDADVAGEVLAEQVYNDCRRRGCIVSILRLPGLVNDGDDVYDWFQIDGNDANKLRELAESGAAVSRAEATFVRQCRAAADAVEKGRGSLDDARKTLMSGLASNVGSKNKADYTAEEALEEWAKRKESGADDAGWYLGVESIDELAGKMVRGKVIGLAGDSGSGKSSYALQMADAVVNTGSAVRIYSQEMDAVENVQRIAARLYKKRVRDFTPSDIRAIARVYRDLPMSIWQQRVTLDYLVNDIRLWAALQDDPGMVVIDFVQLLVPKDREKEDELVKAVAYALKDLAKELGICIVILGQLTVESRRNQTVRKLTKSDVRNGASLIDASDQFFLLQADADSVDSDVKFVNVRLDKFRGGRVGERVLVFDGPHYEFRDKHVAKVIDFQDRYCYSDQVERVEFVDADF